MKISEISEIIDGRIVCGEKYSEKVVKFAFTSDLMSEVLTLNNEKLLLITGLNNLQTIRTAEMTDIRYIVLGNDKKVSPAMIELALDNKILIIESPYSVYKICGLLYKAGLQPIL